MIYPFFDKIPLSGKWLCALLISLSPLPLFAKIPIIYLSPKDKAIHLAPAQFQWLSDASKRLTFEQVLSPTWQQKFRQIPQLNQGYNNTAHWVKICLQPTQQATPRRVLELLTHIENVTFYYREGGQWKSQKKGVVNHQPKQKYFRFSGTTLSFELTKQSIPTVIYVRLQSDVTATILSFKIHEAAYYQGYLVEQNIIYALVYGVMLAFIIYNLFMFFVLRETTYLLYVLLEAVNLVIILIINGHAVSLFSAPAFWWMALDQLLFFGVFVNALFAMYFLDTRQNSRSNHQILVMMATMAGVFFILGAWLNLMQLSIHFVSLCLFIFILNAIYIYMKGVKTAYYYLIAWLFYGAGHWVKTLQVFDFIPSNSLFVIHAPQFGIVLEVLFFSLALGDKINKIKKDKFEVQNQLLFKTRENEQLVMSQKAMLEQEVAARTQKLTASYQEIKQQNEALLKARQKLEKQQALIEQQNNDLQASTQKLEELNQTKDRFFGIIAHDLRRPLASFQEVNYLIDTYLRDNRPQQIKRLGELIHLSAKGLNNLLDNLLNWALVQQEAITYSPELINLESLVNECLSSYRGLIDIHQMNVKTDVLASLKVYADKHTIRCIIHNLVSNAMKFTPNKGTISIKTVVEDAHIILVVQDSGIGMSQETIDQLFNFNQSTSHCGVRGEQGNGLGLGLCKEFAQLNQCKFTVESTLNLGTSFYLTFAKP